MEKIDQFKNCLSITVQYIAILICSFVLSCNSNLTARSALKIDQKTLKIIQKKNLVDNQSFNEFDGDYPLGWPSDLYIPLYSIVNNQGELQFGETNTTIHGFVRMDYNSAAKLMIEGYESNWVINAISNDRIMVSRKDRGKWMVNGFDSSAIIVLYRNGDQILSDSQFANEVNDICRFEISISKKK